MTAAGAAAEVLSATVRDVPDFPAPGVLFKDIGPVLADAEAFAAVVAGLAELARPHGVAAVAGVEARGFLLAAPLALALGASLLPVRKAGKLPGAARSRSYQLEYGEATLELQQGIAPAGTRVLLVDDVLATGGTAAAAAQLLGAESLEVVGFLGLLELTALGGRQHLEQQARLPVEVLLAV